MDLNDALTAASRRTHQLVSGVRPDQLDDPTPCHKWTVGDLVNHLVGGTHLLATMARGEQAADRNEAPPDVTTEDFAALYRHGIDAALRVFADPGLAERTAHLPTGDAPAVMVPQIALMETVVHGWDLANATGQGHGFGADVAAAAYTICGPLVASAPRGEDTFADEVDVDADAPSLDKLVALTGRKP